MINCVYQLTSSGNINLKYEELNFENKVIVKPRYMSICHADQRYYRGKRPQNILKKKLPMALIHECCGVVLKDYSSTFETGTSVVMIPNVISKISQNGIFENYQEGSSFLSSGVDGFMKELVVLDSNRLVPFESKNEHVFAITELLSVAVHAVKRFTSNSHET
ncbi:MAG: alcohol dehydrogenase catalytic domain-containing protein, partial [Firmicutes bacterium]|nr:alcohol dehydrogenase catalytic domain-containing protein [Bacillota bacterium]